MIQFYGSPMSSAGRTHVMLEECGAPYEYHRVVLRDPAQKAEYLKVNPSGKIPFIVDGAVRIPESIAINFYLAERYAPQLWAAELEERARLYAWSLWAISTLQNEALRVLHHTMIVPVEQRSAYEVETGKKNVQRYLDHLDTQLPDGGYLLGDRYTVADLNVASVVNLATALGAGKLAEKSTAWLDKIKARPAWQKAATAG
jgi:glutathione S-transferase